MKEGDRIKFRFYVNDCPYTAVGTIELIDGENIIVINDNKIQRMNISREQIIEIEKGLNDALGNGPRLEPVN